MRVSTGSYLNDMMVHYDRAVAKREARPTVEEVAQQMFDHVRDEVIRPLMTAFGEVLEAHGHHCRIYDKSMSVSTPGNVTQSPEIIMYVLPKAAGEPSPARSNAYRISFLLAQQHGKLLARMAHERGNESCSSCPHDLHPLEGVVPELIEAELLEMMQHVFADAQPPSSVDIGHASGLAAARENSPYLASPTRPPR